MGKIEKFRNCPAVGHRIKPVECGENRGKNYDCPPDCSYCPWTMVNYDDFSQIEGEIDGKTLLFYKNLVGDFESRTNLHIDEINGSEDGELIFQSNAYREFFLREYKPGKRLFDLWREAGWSHLVKNEPFLAGFRAKTRPALLEVRRVVDDLQVECVNLLDDSAGVFTICDRGLSKSALQCQNIIGWVAQYPFFHRTHGIAYNLPACNENALDLVRRHVREMGGPHDGLDQISDWLGGNFLRLMERITDEKKKDLKTMFRNTDVKECVAVYHLNGALADLKLDGREDFSATPPDEEELKKRGDHSQFVWLRAGDSKKWESKLPEALRGGFGGAGIPIWGQIRIFPAHVEITAHIERNFRVMQEMAEVFFGTLLKFEKESVTDLAKQNWPGEDDEPRSSLTHGASYFPEGIDDAGEMMKEVFRAHYRKFLDDHIPALDNLTPREAAKRPEMRQRLISLMKGHLQTMDDHSRKDGRTYDIGWVLDELGLAEMIVPARTASVAAFQTGWWEEVESEEIIAERIASIIENPENVLNLDGFPDVADYFDSIGTDLLNTNERDSLVKLVNYAIAIFVPEGVTPSDIAEEEMYRETRTLFAQLLPQGASVSESLKAYEELINISVQQTFLSFAGTILVSMSSTSKIIAKFHLGKPLRPESILPMMVQIEAFLRCLRRSSLG